MSSGPGPEEPGTGEHRFELVMPFVVCASEGGPYDDAAFVAGARMASTMHALEAGPAEHASYEHPPLLPQLDLVAMHAGYSMTTERYSDEWMLCTFRPVSPAGADR